MNPLTMITHMVSKRPVLSIAAFLVGIIIVGIVVRSSSTPQSAINAGTETSVVSVRPVADLASSNSVELVGTVEAVHEAKIATEAAGRVIGVNVALGDTVSSGQVIATLENAAQRAAVLQAQGAYDAAIAGAAQSTVSVSKAETGLTSAENTAVSTVRSSFVTANNIVLNTIDSTFTNGTRYNASPNVTDPAHFDELKNARIALQTTMASWQDLANSITTDSDLPSALATAQNDTNAIIALIDTEIPLIAREPAGAQFTQTELDTFASAYASARQSLVTILSNIDTVLASLRSAEDTLQSARIGGSDAENSLASASIKQARGALDAAQAALSKTIIRTPIAGTVNALPIKVGNYVSVLAPVATVANNNALIVTTYVTESDRRSIAIGDHVRVGTHATGTVSNIAPAVDPATGKTEVKVALEQSPDIQNGDTVTVQFLANTSTASGGPLRVPLSAFKITPDGPVAFTVDAHNSLVAHPVTLGAIAGDAVTVVAGLAPDMVIVTDARGLKPGEMVTVAK